MASVKDTLESILDRLHSQNVQYVVMSPTDGFPGSPVYKTIDILCKSKSDLCAVARLSPIPGKEFSFKNNSIDDIVFNVVETGMHYFPETLCSRILNGRVMDGYSKAYVPDYDSAFWAAVYDVFVHGRSPNNVAHQRSVFRMLNGRFRVARCKYKSVPSKGMLYG